MEDKPLKILILDSGVGGFTIFSEIKKALPTAHLTAVCDNDFFPYGKRPFTKLSDHLSQLTQTLIAKFSPDIIVIACNTASTLILDRLRSEHPNISFVGVVPAIKTASEISQTRSIGLLATPATVDRDYTAQLIESFASDCRVLSIGNEHLAAMAESKLLGDPVDIERLAGILSPFRENSEIDAVVLGCTHFPLLSEEIISILGDKVKVIDSGRAIAQRVSHLCENLCFCEKLSLRENLSRNNENPKTELVLTSGKMSDEHRKKLARHINAQQITVLDQRQSFQVQR